MIDSIAVMNEITKRTQYKAFFVPIQEPVPRLTVWKWSGESRYPGALRLVLENFRRAFSPGPTDCPWVSEDGCTYVLGEGGGGAMIFSPDKSASLEGGVRKKNP